jgi:hypothetical protein
VDHDQRDQLFVVLSAAFGIRSMAEKSGESKETRNMQDGYQAEFKNSRIHA